MRPKRLLIIAGAVALVLGGAWLALQQAFPPQRIAEIAAAQVSSQTGREFRIQGRLDWQLVPKLAVVADDLTMANAPWGSRPDMLRVKRAAIQLQLWPLLRGQVNIESVALDGVDLLLETDAKGVGNWNMPWPDKADGDQGGEAETPRRFGIDDLKLHDTLIGYRDGVSGQQQAVTIRQLELEANAQGLKLDADTVVHDQRWQASGQLGAIAQLLANQADWPFQLALRSDGARVDVQAQLLQGPTPRTGRFDIDAAIDKAAALKPWLADAGKVPLPIALKTTLNLTTGALQADPLKLSIAGQALNGSASLRNAKPWQAQATLNADTLDLTHALPSPVSGLASSGKRERLFDDKPLPIDRLPQGQAAFDLRVARLLLPDAPPLSALHASARLRPGSLKIEPLNFGLAGGKVRGGVALDTPVGAAPRLNLSIDADGLSAETLARAAGAAHYISGGRLRLKTDLAMAGRSASALAAGANGEVLVSLTDARLGEGVSPIGPNLLQQVLRAITLQPQAAKSTQLECAVMRLPFKNGVASVQRTIAIETPDLGISVVGQIDLRDQSMELAFRPTPKHPLALNTAQLASLVMAKGPLLDPKLTLDAKGAAGMALSIGAAVATGGLSVLGQSLLKQAADPHPCQYALGGVAAQPKADPGAAPAAPEAPPPEQALPGFLRKLFKK